MVKTRDTLVSAMDSDIVTFTFTKSNGSSRIAEGTRNLDIIPINAHPKGDGTRKKAEGVVTYFDWSRQEWRSFKLSSVYGPWKITDDHAMIRDIAEKAKLF